MLAVRQQVASLSAGQLPADVAKATTDIRRNSQRSVESLQAAVVVVEEAAEAEVAAAHPFPARPFHSMH